MRIHRSFLLVLFAALPFTLTMGQTNIDPSRTAEAISQTPAFAQQNAAAATAGTIQEDTSFAPTSPGDQDIGQQYILKRNERRDPWHASLDNSLFWTDNAADVHAGKTPDWFWVGGATVSYQPQLTNRVLLDIDLGQHFFQYNRATALDFQSGEASAGVIVLAPEIWNTVWFANYYYERLTQGLGNRPIYDTQDIRVGVQKNVAIDRLNSIAFGLQAALAVDGQPSAFQRHEFSMNAAYNFKVMRDLTFNVSNKLTYYDYFEANGRRDWYDNIGVAFIYQPRTWIELALGYNFAYNHSNQETFSYESQLTGPSVTLKAKF